ncbi:hypothetical protein BDF20DRAFT_909583 [Mycotypha africana]|uniref:uncharacterized protein n=1 Tax=Mycotypha africana TaxID=64632 RepID=UPI002300060C|nr:uncharacterized protein BDF20DRAFT_909583 [Mycotypha africana]KAI8991862.1 hypothetical protein BDF20DRAFT_909583 [Mycotypha africana]
MAQTVVEKVDQLSQTLFPGLPPQLHLLTAVEVINNAAINTDDVLNNDRSTLKTVQNMLRYLRIRAITGDVEAKLKLWTILKRKQPTDKAYPEKNNEATLWARSLFDRQLMNALSHCSLELIALVTEDAENSSFTNIIFKAANRKSYTKDTSSEKQRRRKNKQHRNMSYLMGLLLISGIGVKQDVSEGATLLAKAFKLGHEGAGIELAKVFNDPYKFPQQYNVEKSLQICETVVEQKNLRGPFDRSAIIDLARIYYEGSETVARDIEKAYKFARRIAESLGEQYCQFIVGDTLLEPPANSTIQRDVQQAIFWLTQSGNQGFPLAIETMSRIYFEGKAEGFLQNYETARHWCLLGDEVWPYGLDYCQTCLGDMFYFGLGVPKDLFRAFEYYQKAASQSGTSSTQSQFMLGEMFFKTEGWNRNLLLATDYYKMSAKGKYAPAEQRLQELITIEESSKHTEKKAAKKKSWMGLLRLLNKKKG